MKVQLITSLLLLFFSFESQAWYNPFNWEESQEIKTAYGKTAVFNPTEDPALDFELDQVIEGVIRTNSRNIFIQGELITSEDFAQKKYPDDEFYCEVNVFKSESAPTQLQNPLELKVLEENSDGSRSYKWTSATSWVSVELSNDVGDTAGRIKCSRIDSSQAIGFAPFIKMLKPLIELH